MTLQQIREQFIKLSGRYDLVSDRNAGSYADNGANYFIQAGQKILDGLQTVDKQVMRFQADQIVGTGVLEVKYLRAIYHVWAYDSSNSGNRHELDRADLQWLKKQYNEPLANLDTNSPVYYAPVPVALAPEQRAITSSNYSDTFTYNYEDLVFSDEFESSKGHWRIKGILIRPPLDTTYMIEIEGLFESALEQDTDTSYWSVVYPDLSVEAAMVAMEIPYRNTQGVRDLLDPIRMKLDGLDKDQATEITHAYQEMEG